MNRAERRALTKRIGADRATAIAEADRLATAAVATSRADPDNHELRARAFALVETRNVLRVAAGLEEVAP